MDDYTKKILFKCLIILIDKLNIACLENRVENNLFAKILEELPNNEQISEFDYNFIYIYIVAVLLNNRAFFNHRFEKLPWNLPLHIFHSNSTMNGYSVCDYGFKEPRTEEEKKLEEDSKENDYTDYPGFFDEYSSYLNQKYKGSPYEPDALEMVTFEQKYNDEHISDLFCFDVAETNYEEEVYNDALMSLPMRLKNKNGPNINLIIQCMRNALAHKQFNYNDAGVLMYTKDTQTGLKNFECEIEENDMINILKEYINILSRIKNVKETPYIMYLVFNGLYEINTNFSYFYTKDILFNEFKILGLEDDFHKIMSDVEKNIEINRKEYLENHDIDNTDDEEDCLNIDRLLIMIEYVRNYFVNNYQAIYDECKLLEILYIMEDFNKLLENNIFKLPKSMNSKKNYMEDFDEPIATIEKSFPSLYQVDVESENKEILAKISVLLNIIFVQCSFENVDVSLIDLSAVKINDEYIEAKKKTFAPKIARIKSNCYMAIEGINRLKEAIKNGKTSADKKENLVFMKNNLWRMRDNALKLKSEWNNSLKFTNTSIINHIRNSFAHGSYFIQPPEFGVDLKSLNIMIRDYEPETDKLTFSGMVSVYDLLIQVLKPEVIQQLFDLKSMKRK